MSVRSAVGGSQIETKRVEIPEDLSDTSARALWVSSRTRLLRAQPEIAKWVIEPCYDDPFPDYDTEPVMMYANG